MTGLLQMILRISSLQPGFSPFSLYQNTEIIIKLFDVVRIMLLVTCSEILRKHGPLAPIPAEPQNGHTDTESVEQQHAGREHPMKTFD